MLLKCGWNNVGQGLRLKLHIPYKTLLLGPTLLYGFGAALNLIVMAANHSQMPVQVPPGLDMDPSDWIHGTLTAATHLKLLCDIFPIKGLGVASIGDFFLWAGDFLQIPCLVAWFTLMISDRNE
jgi:hypothetical protein